MSLHKLTLSHYAQPPSLPEAAKMVLFFNFCSFLTLFSHSEERVDKRLSDVGVSLRASALARLPQAVKRVLDYSIYFVVLGKP